MHVSISVWQCFTTIWWCLNNSKWNLFHWSFQFQKIWLLGSWAGHTPLVPFFMPHPLTHTVPHFPFWKTSTWPSAWLSPPDSLNSPSCGSKFGCKRKHKSTWEQSMCYTTIYMTKVSLSTKQNNKKLIFFSLLANVYKILAPSFTFLKKGRPGVYLLFSGEQCKCCSLCFQLLAKVCHKYVHCICILTQFFMSFIYWNSSFSLYMRIHGTVTICAKAGPYANEERLRRTETKILL